MKRPLLAGGATFVAWTLLDALAHRLLLAPLYESGTNIWRPLADVSAALVVGVTVLLSAVFVATYNLLVRPRSFSAGLGFGGLFGVALGASSGFGTYIHSPIPLALACGWFVLGTVKGLVAGLALGAIIEDGKA
jgi:hypothetical protein